MGCIPCNDTRFQVVSVCIEVGVTVLFSLLNSSTPEYLEERKRGNRFLCKKWPQILHNLGSRNHQNLSCLCVGHACIGPVSIYRGIFRPGCLLMIIINTIAGGYKTLWKNMTRSFSLPYPFSCFFLQVCGGGGMHKQSRPFCMACQNSASWTLQAHVIFFFYQWASHWVSIFPLLMNDWFAGCWNTNVPSQRISRDRIAIFHKLLWCDFPANWSLSISFVSKPDSRYLFECREWPYVRCKAESFGKKVCF